jgi:hypothetical protein
MALQEILIVLGGNVALLAALAFLTKSIVAHWLNKDFERFKEKLSSSYQMELERTKSSLQREANTELERLKGALALAASEHSILLSRLQDRRAEVIGELYGKIAAAIRLLDSLLKLGPRQLEDEPYISHKARDAFSAITTAEEKFDETRIWLTERCASSVDELVERIRFTHTIFIRYLGYASRPRTEQEEETEDRREPEAVREARRNELNQIWEVMTQKEVPIARLALEMEMRSLLSSAAQFSQTLASTGKSA